MIKDQPHKLYVNIPLTSYQDLREQVERARLEMFTQCVLVLCIRCAAGEKLEYAHGHPHHNGIVCKAELLRHAFPELAALLDARPVLAADGAGA